ncbi:hypothetical protein [Escherichia coli]|uniref:hypothetical protein n=1 Tax=Escherichia coli TaxID=562 RepID=UPI00201A044C|nr:hypothetical protein [Escherichia coli]
MFCFTALSYPVFQHKTRYPLKLSHIILRPVRPTWGSFLELEKADPDFMTEREDVVSDEGRVNL